MSILINSWPIGIGIALVVVGPLGQFAGWPSGIIATAVFAAVGFFLVLAVYRAPSLATAGSAVGFGLRELSRREWQLLMLGSLPWFLYNAAFQIVISFLPLFFVGKGLDISHAGSLVALNTVMFVVGVQAGGLLPKDARRRDPLCHMAIFGWCLTLLLLASGIAPLPWIVVGGLLGGVPAAALVSMPAEFLRPESRNAGMGIFYTIYYFGCALLPAAAGALYEASGGPAALWMATAVALCCVPIIWLFRRAMTNRP
ncbi:MAG: MFS transporter [Lautropia sp.]|nr:MFS transporter [Lautropia sp.]